MITEEHYPWWIAYGDILSDRICSQRNYKNVQMNNETNECDQG